MRRWSVSSARLVAAAIALSIVALPRVAVGRSGGSAFVSAALSMARLSSDATATESFGTYEIGFGYRFRGPRDHHRWSRFSLELGVTGKSGGVEMLASPSYPADEAMFSLLWVGARLDLFSTARSRWTPWVGIGAGVATVDGREHGRNEGGAGAVWAFGADVHLTRGLMLRGRLSTIEAGSVRAAAGSLALVFEFWRPPHHRRPEWGEEIPPEPTQTKPAADESTSRPDGA